MQVQVQVKKNYNSKRNRNDDLSKDVLLSVRDHFKKPQTVEDRYDFFGKTVAIRLRGLENRKGLIAEKMINDILFEAEMGSLSVPIRHNARHVLDHHTRSSFSSNSGSPSPTFINIPHSSPSSLYQLQDLQQSGPGPGPHQEVQPTQESLQAEFSQNTAASFLSSFTGHT